MATLVLTTVGSVLGGPVGGALGAYVGNTIDGKLFGPKREGARLKDLQVSGSGYGEPIARHFGTVRASGTIIWATDLKESSEEASAGKGQPSTTSYTYSISMAVLLASAPIDGVGRIWADGNLLRGAAGDLKAQGMLRLHLGHEDQSADPLLAAALGPRCPAMRGCAYAVFEDLSLADFGNRIPALSFEIEAGEAASLLHRSCAQSGIAAGGTADFSQLRGFSHEGGSLGELVDLVSALDPVVTSVANGTLSMRPADGDSATAIRLGPAIAWDDGDFGRRDGMNRSRGVAGAGRALGAIRYYDPTRDYQPGLQRSAGSLDGAQTTLDFPGVLSAADARALVERARQRRQLQDETIAVRVASVDAQIRPGALVTVADMPGLWRVASWEWREGGVELQLARFVVTPPPGLVADAGAAWSGKDRLPQPTILRAFELPWNGLGSSASRQVYLAASAATGLWSGAALYAVDGGALEPIGTAPSRRAITGLSVTALATSPASRFESGATVDIDLADADAWLVSATVEDLAKGSNRALLGDEIIQFARAIPLGGTLWRLEGLLRGRGGTERAAQTGTPGGSPFALLDDRLVPVSEAALAAADRNGFAAIGRGDREPVTCALEGAGESLRPLSPVHPRIALLPNGDRTIRWIRRARGGWSWLDEVEQPLVEESEAYEIGVGPTESPRQTWSVSAPVVNFSASQWAGVSMAHAGKPLWVRQLGRFAKSHPLLLATFA